MTTDTIEFTPEMTEALMLAAIADRGPDYVYARPPRDKSDHMPRCVYVANGAPSCLVGDVLFRAGVTLEAMEQHNMESAYRLFNRLHGLIEIDDDSINMLTAAQVVQDDSKTWADAYFTGKAAVYLEDQDDLQTRTGGRYYLA